MSLTTDQLMSRIARDFDLDGLGVLVAEGDAVVRVDDNAGKDFRLCGRGGALRWLGEGAGGHQQKCGKENEFFHAAYGLAAQR